MDAVVTYCNTGSREWQEAYANTLEAVERRGKAHPRDSYSKNRFLSIFDEVVYCVKGIREFAPWVRQIFLVTNAVPTNAVISQLEPERSPPLSIVLHADIFGDSSHLPTFNSNAIENNLHRVPGISDIFLNFNDDVILTSPVSPGDFVALGRTLLHTNSNLSFEGSEKRGECAYCTMWRNVNRLLDRRFGYQRRTVLDHIPLVARRSTMATLWERYRTELEKTSASKFRGFDDINLICALAPYTELYIGLAEVAPRNFISSVTLYTASVASDLQKHTRTVLARRPQILCIQSSHVVEEEQSRDLKAEIIQDLLSRLFPQLTSPNRPTV